MNRAIVISVIVLTLSGLSAVQDNKLTDTRSVSINFPDSVIHARILITKSHFKPDHHKDYFWYVPDCIHVNQGGYAGYLLHGDYCVYDRNQHLIVKGAFTKGLKTGTWERWYSNGKLAEISGWKEGIPSGTARFFDQKGALVKEVNLNRHKKKKLSAWFKKTGRVDVTSDSLQVPVDSTTKGLIK